MAAPKRVIRQGSGVDDLPPAGDAQREMLREREDDLAEAAETLAGAADVHVAKPDAYQIENELAQHFNELEVSNQDPAFAYCWVQSGFYGRMVKMKLTEGWEVVQGDMEEAIELKGMGADTTRRLGDVILMRISRDRYLKLKLREKNKRIAQEQSVTGTLAEMGHKYRDLGLVVHTDLKDLHPQTVSRMAARAEAIGQAEKIQDEWVRQGRVPGRPAPGVR